MMGTLPYWIIRKKSATNHHFSHVAGALVPDSGALLSKMNRITIQNASQGQPLAHARGE